MVQSIERLTHQLGIDQTSVHFDRFFLVRHLYSSRSILRAVGVFLYN